MLHCNWNFFLSQLVKALDAIGLESNRLSEMVRKMYEPLMIIMILIVFLITMPILLIKTVMMTDTMMMMMMMIIVVLPVMVLALLMLSMIVEMSMLIRPKHFLWAWMAPDNKTESTRMVPLTILSGSSHWQTSASPSSLFPDPSKKKIYTSLQPSKQTFDHETNKIG